MTQDYAMMGDPDVVIAGFDQISSMLVFYEGPECVVVAMNEPVRALLWPREPLGRPAREVMPDLAGQQWHERFEEVYATGAPFTAHEWRMQLTGPDRTGREIYLNFTLVPWRYPDGRIRGVVGQGIEVTDLVQARLAAQAQSAELAQRYQQSRDVVIALQQALLPTELPVLPGMQIAARYLLADEDTVAGGDWFDAVPLGAGRVALVVGDVVGHGVAASAVMGQLRAVLVERLCSGAGLAGAVADLDRFAAAVPGGHAATVCVVVLEAGSGALHYCTAGHPPPLIMTTDGQTRYLPGSGAGPLATGSGLPIAEARLDVGDLVLLYSDGLIERPGRTPAQGTVELAQVAADSAANRALPLGAPVEIAERVCQQSLELLTRCTGYTDDITVLAAQRVSAPPQLRLRLPAEVTAVRAVRLEYGRWLGEVNAGPEDTLVLQHALGELVTNAVEHAYADRPQTGAVSVSADLTVDGDIRTTVTDHGRWRAPDILAATATHRGHGLAMVADMVDSIHTERRTDGTTVALRHRLHRPARVLIGPSAVAGQVSATRPEMPFTTELTPLPTPRLTVYGPVDLLSATRLRDDLLRETRGGTVSLTVDLTGVTHLASAGVQVLHEATDRSATQGAQLRLFAPPGSPAQHVLVLVALPHHTSDPDHPRLAPRNGPLTDGER